MEIKKISTWLDPYTLPVLFWLFDLHQSRWTDTNGPTEYTLVTIITEVHVAAGGQMTDLRLPGCTGSTVDSGIEWLAVLAWGQPSLRRQSWMKQTARVLSLASFLRHQWLRQLHSHGVSHPGPPAAGTPSRQPPAAATLQIAHEQHELHWINVSANRLNY